MSQNFNEDPTENLKKPMSATLDPSVCRVCNLPIGEEGRSQYAVFGGLPSPCCKHCFEANDYTCKTQSDVMQKSIERRKRLKAFPFDSEL